MSDEGPAGIPAHAQAAYRRLQDARDESYDPPCTQAPELWHSTNHYDQLTAKEMCRQCPLITECLTYALTADEKYSVWGGLSSKERERLRKHAGPSRREPQSA